METFTAEEIGRNDRIMLPGDDLPYLVDWAWTATDGMVYVRFSSGDEEQYGPDEMFEEHPVTGTLHKRTN